MSSTSGPSIPNAERRKRGQYMVTVRLRSSLLAALDRMLVDDEDTRPAVIRRWLESKTTKERTKRVKG